MNHWNHPEYKALYAAVMAAPKDDTPRLILCDWLEDRCRTVTVRLPFLANTTSQDVPAGG